MSSIPNRRTRYQKILRPYLLSRRVGNEVRQAGVGLWNADEAEGRIQMLAVIIFEIPWPSQHQQQRKHWRMK